jgi:ABC-2 type transport system permease protein
VFVALVGPEVLCPDRRDGMLGLYLASPLTRDTYLLAKALAVVPVIAIVTVGPPLLLLVGRTFADAGPDSIADFLGILVRVVASGLAISAAYTAISLAAASLTDRRAVASAGVILLLLVSSVATNVLVELGGRRAPAAAQPVPPPLRARAAHLRGARRGARPDHRRARGRQRRPWTAGAALLVRERYRRLQVTR